MIRKVVSSARRPKAAVFRGKNEQKAQKIYFDRALRTPHVEVVCGHFAKVIFSIFSDILVLVPFPDFEHLQFVHKFELSALKGGKTYRNRRVLHHEHATLLFAEANRRPHTRLVKMKTGNEMQIKAAFMRVSRPGKLFICRLAVE